jgi:hypothetical protein
VDTSVHGKTSSIPKPLIMIVGQIRLDTASFHSGMMTSRLSLMNSGEPEVVQKDHPKKIGSMPPNNCDPAHTPVDPGDHACPKCGVEMEPIETTVEGPQVQQLQLCPICYLVTWSDSASLHVQKGVPMEKDASPGSEAGWLLGEPKEC